MKVMLVSVQASLCDDPALELGAACRCLGIEVTVGDTQQTQK